MRAMNDYTANLPENEKIQQDKEFWWDKIPKRATNIMSSSNMEISDRKRKVELVIAKYN